MTGTIEVMDPVPGLPAFGAVALLLLVSGLGVVVLGRRSVLGN